jgi:hypothetical protein
VVDELDHAIAALGLLLQRPGNQEVEPIHDVQIWSDGAMTCRLTRTPAAVTNGTVAHRTSAQPAAE